MTTTTHTNPELEKLIKQFEIKSKKRIKRKIAKILKDHE
jgi:ribosomal protein L18E